MIRTRALHGPKYLGPARPVCFLRYTAQPGPAVAV